MTSVTRGTVVVYVVAMVAVACGGDASVTDATSASGREPPEVESGGSSTVTIQGDPVRSADYESTVDSGNAITTDVPLDSTGETPAIGDSGPSTAEIPDAAVRSLDFRSPVDGGIASVEYTVPAVATRVPVPLLQDVIAPCVPLERVDHNPCGPGVPPSVEMPGAEGTPLSWVEDPPTFQEMMEGHGAFFQIPHIVIRATVIPDTTRCDGYLIVEHDYMGEPQYANHRFYYCFANVAWGVKRVHRGRRPRIPHRRPRPLQLLRDPAPPDLAQR